MPPRFSVVIPTFNRPRMLRAAIAGVLAQRERAFEIVVADDGDGGGARAAAEIGDTRVAALDNRKRGQVAARNLAVAHAKGSFIAFLDDDDGWSDPEHLLRAAAAMEDGADLWFAGGTIVADGRPPLPYAVPADVLTLKRDNAILVSAVCYRKSLHRRLGSFDETFRFYWDWDWYLRIARAGGRLVHEPRASVSIRRHGGNVTGNGREPERAAELARFAAKHGLGRLELKTHADLVS